MTLEGLYTPSLHRETTDSDLVLLHAAIVSNICIPIKHSSTDVTSDHFTQCTMFVTSLPLFLFQLKK